MKKLLSVLAFVAAIALGVIGTRMFQNVMVKPDPVVIVHDIQGTINQIGELSTSEYAYQIVQSVDKDQIKLVGINIPFTSSTIMYSYEGVIKAGIRFSEIEVTVNEAKKEIYVDLPTVEIFSNELDLNSLIVYQDRQSWVNQFTFEDLNASQAEAKEKAKENAIKHGLLESAEENAKVLLTATIQNFYNLNEWSVEYY